MELIKSDPNAMPELTDLSPWFNFINGIIAPAPDAIEAQQSLDFFKAYAGLLTGTPRRILLWGPGNLIAASEFSLDLFRSLTTTISGLEPGGLEDEHAEIHYHPCLHRCDNRRLTDAVKNHPNDSFVVVAVDFIVSGGDWINISLNPTASSPWPSLNLLRWLHADFNLSDVSPRIEVLRRWAVNFAPNQSLKVVN